MRSIYKVDLIEIDVTNACNNQCANCTRFVGHHKKPFFMDLGTVRKAIESLEGFPGAIGLMGGEPTMHPQFKEICKIYQEMIPDRKKRRLFTSGYKWKEYEGIRNEVFDPECVCYNDHSAKDEGWHQPLLIAADEIIEDKKLMWKLIDNCWIQKRWSPSITPKGCYFCEVAAAYDMLFDGQGGWPIEKGWWNKKPEQFQDQVKRFCPNCSAAIPMKIPSNHEKFDLASSKNIEKLKKIGSPKILSGSVKEYSKKYGYEDFKECFKDWAPGYYRDFVQHVQEKKEEKTWKKTGYENWTSKRRKKSKKISTRLIDCIIDEEERKP